MDLCYCLLCSLYISCRAVIIYLSLCSSGNLYFSLHSWRIIFLNIGFVFDSLFLSTLWWCHLTAFTVSNERLLRSPFTYWVTFFLLILWLSLSFDSVTLGLAVVILEFILLRIYWSFWMYRLRFFINLESFWPLSFQIFSLFLSLFLGFLCKYVVMLDDNPPISKSLLISLG